MQDYQRILEALEKLRSFLESYKGDLDTQIGIYRSWVQNMRSEGVPTQVAGAYEQDFFAENESWIKRTINNIEQNDLPYIKKHIAKVEDLLRS